MCVPILYSTALSKTLTIYKCCLMAPLGYFMYRVMSSPNKGALTSSFTICIIFISLSSLIAWAKTSSTVLSKSGEGEILWLVPYFLGNALMFCPFSVDLLPVDLLYVAFIMLRYYLSLLVFSGLLS